MIASARSRAASASASPVRASREPSSSWNIVPRSPAAAMPGIAASEVPTSPTAAVPRRTASAAARAAASRRCLVVCVLGGAQVAGDPSDEARAARHVIEEPRQLEVRVRVDEPGQERALGAALGRVGEAAAQLVSRAHGAHGVVVVERDGALGEPRRASGHHGDDRGRADDSHGLVAYAASRS